MKIELSSPESKGIASYAWKPATDKDQSSVVSLALFGGMIEHWNTTNSSFGLSRVQGWKLS